ncbi:MAG TPA: type II toxin-antitoxin system HigB family toxin [Phycisphaerae bacterium]|nr:type II toxin-antitoxin system HigB family toxin [Phycisphaerae bacterium]
MRVISQKVLQDFWELHPDAEEPLRAWFKTALAARWRNLNEIRRIYTHADGVATKRSGVLTVFNVCGNKCRLVVRIRYDWQLINIRGVLTHREYDTGRWKE